MTSSDQSVGETNQNDKKPIQNGYYCRTCDWEAHPYKSPPKPPIQARHHKTKNPEHQVYYWQPGFDDEERIDTISAKCKRLIRGVIDAF